MISINIVEDNIEDGQNLKKALTKYFNERREKYSLKHFRDGFEFLEKYGYDCDIAFLDIRLLGLDGMSVAKELRARDKEVCIIFVTSMIQFAVNGYEVDAVGYILKPIDYLLFKVFMDKAMKLVYERKSAPTICIKAKGRSIRLQIRDLLYIESDRHDLLYHTKDSVVRVTGKLSDVEEELSGYNFYRCSQSYLVNLRYIDTVDGNDILLCGERIAASRRRKTEFLQKLNEYWADGGRGG